MGPIPTNAEDECGALWQRSWRGPPDWPAGTAPTQPCTSSLNGSFETGDFTSWVTYDHPEGDPDGFIVTRDTTLPAMTILAPPDSAYAAVTTQIGPGLHIVYQDVALPAGRTATFRATVYVATAASAFVIAETAGLGFLGEANQQFRVDVMDPAAAPDVGAGVLRLIYQTQPADPTSSGYIVLTADLSAFAGRTVRIRFAEVDNQDVLYAAVDAVDVEITD
jgi:hypothetical protein